MEDPSLLSLILSALGAYVIGSIPTAFLVVKRFSGQNVMEQGTGNVGTLNTLRATGSKKLTALVLLGDSGKGALALLLSYLVALGFGHEPELLMQVGGLVAIVGHNYSAFLKLKGGKGLATALPVLLYLEPILVGVWVGAFLLSVATTRLMVMGQIMGTVAAAIVGAAAFGDSSIPVGILAALVFIKHAPRLRNVFNGTEPKMYYKIKEAGR